MFAARVLANLYPLSRRLPASRTKSRLGRILTAVIAPLKGDLALTARLHDGSVVLLDPRSRTEAYPYWNGEYEVELVEFLKACVRPGDTVFDVGANVGLIAIPLARHLSTVGGSLVGFEPIPSNFRRLQSAIELNELTNVRIFNVALGDHEGTVDLFLENDFGASTGNAVLACENDGERRHQRFSVKLWTLDNFAQAERLDSCSLMKLDIEGAEIMLLRGAQAFIQKHRPVIYGEFHAQLIKKFGYSFLDVAAMTNSWGYRIFGFERRANSLRLKELLEPKVGMGDCLFIPKERVDSVPHEITLGAY